MNVEMFFVQTDDFLKLKDIICQRIKSSPDAINQQPDWRLPSSYDVILSKEPKRKVALSSSIAGWIAGIESKEVIDFALLQQIAETLKTNVVAVQLSEVSGCCGYALCEKGIIRNHYFSEKDDDPSGAIIKFLEHYEINFRLISFKEAVQMRNQDWMILS
ncbi:MAG: hypothetical protein ACOY3I_01925 [Verrucomicrobiota bacterium]